MHTFAIWKGRNYFMKKSVWQRFPVLSRGKNGLVVSILSLLVVILVVFLPINRTQLLQVKLTTPFASGNAGTFGNADLESASTGKTYLFPPTKVTSLDGPLAIEPIIITVTLSG